jgi:hypothetical protein
MNRKTTPRRVPTNTIADMLCVRPASIRRAYCVHGHYMGMKPVKLPNGRLLWPEDQADKIISQNAER